MPGVLCCSRIGPGNGLVQACTCVDVRSLVHLVTPLPLLFEVDKVIELWMCDMYSRTAG